MRTRNHHISIWLNDAERQHLTEQAHLSGLGVDPFIRSLILGIKLRPHPPDSYAKLLLELSAIGNNINQIARNTNASKCVTADEIQEAVRLTRQAWRLVKDAF